MALTILTIARATAVTEDLAGLFVIAMIVLSSVLATSEAIHRVLHSQQVNHL